jgi:ribosomal protein S27AE
MPTATPELTIDVSGASPAQPSPWLVRVFVKLKMPDGSVKAAPAGSCSVHVEEFNVVTKQVTADFGTKDVDSDGKAEFTLPGAFYIFPAWWAHTYRITGTHKATGRSVQKIIYLDSQIPVTGTWAWPWDPFPYSEEQRKWSDPEPFTCVVCGSQVLMYGERVACGVCGSIYRRA